MSYFEEIKKKLYKFKHLGEETVPETGALLIGRAPHIARQAWLHSIYPVLNEQDISKLKSELKTEIPKD